MKQAKWDNGVLISLTIMQDQDGNRIPGVQTFTPLVPLGDHEIAVAEKKNGKPIAVYGDATRAYGKAGVDISDLGFEGDTEGLKDHFVKTVVYRQLEPEAAPQPKAAPSMPTLHVAQGGHTQQPQAAQKGVLRGNGK